MEQRASNDKALQEQVTTCASDAVDVAIELQSAAHHLPIPMSIHWKMTTRGKNVGTIQVGMIQAGRMPTGANLPQHHGLHHGYLHQP